jgi:hypothetical protein
VVASESTLRRARPRRQTTIEPARSGAVTVWAGIAVVWLVIAVQALPWWVVSDDFVPAPLIGPDRMT